MYILNKCPGVNALLNKELAAYYNRNCIPNFTYLIYIYLLPILSTYP